MQLVDWIIGSVLILSSCGVVLAKRPIYSSLCFLLTLLALATLYLELSAQFIAAMQVLVYAGAILVIFMFVIMLFQDAHYNISKIKRQSSLALLIPAAAAFFSTLLFAGYKLIGLEFFQKEPPSNFGTVESLGKALYLDFFFPFEVIIFLFLIALIGAFYIGKKVR